MLSEPPHVPPLANFCVTPDRFASTVPSAVYWMFVNGAEPASACGRVAVASTSMSSYE